MYAASWIFMLNYMRTLIKVTQKHWETTLQDNCTLNSSFFERRFVSKTTKTGELLDQITTSVAQTLQLLSSS